MMNQFFEKIDLKCALFLPCTKMDKTGKKIKARSNANDVFITPVPLVKLHVEMCREYIVEGDVLLDPFYGTGNYFNAMKELSSTEYTEISLGKDFFEHQGKTDCIISNPPYSMIDAVLSKSVELNPHTISYLIGQGNLTTKRIEYMNTHGYFLSKLHMTKVYNWYGMSYIVVFTKKATSNCVSFDRTVHK